MQNLSKRRIGEHVSFLDEFAAALAPWGTPQNAARLYAYLLLSASPVGLDQIAADLQISKSLACTAAKVLEQQNMVRRYREGGSKRVFYGASERPGGPVAKQTALLGILEQLMLNAIPTAPNTKAADRLRNFADFYSRLREAMDGVLRAASGISSVRGARVTSYRTRRHRMEGQSHVRKS